MTIARSFLCKARANIKRDRIFESQNRHKEQKRIGQYDIKNEHVRKVFNTFFYKLYIFYKQHKVETRFL